MGVWVYVCMHICSSINSGMPDEISTKLGTQMTYNVEKSTMDYETLRSTRGWGGKGAIKLTIFQEEKHLPKGDNR